MKEKWTKEQQQVIDLRGKDLLVSAAAGAGKTAVLVERIIERITDERDPIDVDQLLVVTFTEAAAAEMRERIRTAIDDLLAVHPTDEHLQRQSVLLHHAQINTIDGFCMSVIRDYFHVIDLDPGFRVAEDSELTLLRQDTLDEVLETAYQEGSRAFLDLSDAYGTGRTDQKLEELILKVYGFSQSYPYPETWLTDSLKMYEGVQQGASRLEERIRDQVQVLVREALEEVERLRAICGYPSGPYMYEEALQDDRNVLVGLVKESYGQMQECFSQVKWARLASNRDETVDKELADQVKAGRAAVKKMVEDLWDQFFAQSAEEMLADLQLCGRYVREIVRVVMAFSERFTEKKRKKNLIDFGDMEHLALQILTGGKEGASDPGSVAGEYQAHFREVMIDEYQDSNFLQEAILQSVSGGGETHNRFMVGDVKQSIYRFRLARPELFLEKYKRYGDRENTEQMRIDLQKNFRSRQEVIDSTNFLFRQLMDASLGNINYDRQAALYRGADYPEGAGYDTELLLIDPCTVADAVQPEATGEPSATEGTDATEEPDATELTEQQIEETRQELEARAVAARIRELVAEQQVWDRKQEKYRRATYGDIVILSRSLTGWSESFSQVLAREGIPLYVGSRTGYFQTQEIALLLDYLRLIDNGLQDMPLAAVLTSGFCGLTAEEMAEIRIHAGGECSFCEAVLMAVRDGDNQSIKEKLNRFYSRIDNYREMVSYTPISKLLERILRETGYLNRMSAMPGGNQRRANIQMLLQKARSFEETSYKGLFHFIRYMEQLEKYQVDYGEANVLEEQADVVRMMSIHKSKGLEFPIVILVGLNKRFNNQDVRGGFLLHPELGIAMDAVDLDARTKTPTLLKQVVKSELRKDTLGEEMRILYVAMTRAREKLIMTGVVTDLEALLKKNQYLQELRGEVLPYHVRLHAGSYLEWVLPAVLRNQAADPFWEMIGRQPASGSALYREDPGISLRYLQFPALVEASVKQEVKQSLFWQGRWQSALSQKPDPQVERVFSYQYPYGKEASLQLKFTVSELKKRQHPEEELMWEDETEQGTVLNKESAVIPLLPRFISREEPLKGASRGTAYHRLMELLDYRKSWEESTLRQEMRRLTEEEKWTAQMAESIRMEDVLHFLRSPLAARMGRAQEQGTFHAEQPFVIGIPAKQVYPEEDSTETVLVQGIIDVFFEEAGELVVVDYKTDRVEEAQELVDRYHVQLDYYAEALEQMTGKRVRERRIYSFALGEEIGL